LSRWPGSPWQPQHSSDSTCLLPAASRPTSRLLALGWILEYVSLPIAVNLTDAEARRGGTTTVDKLANALSSRGLISPSKRKKESVERDKEAEANGNGNGNNVEDKEAGERSEKEKMKEKERDGSSREEKHPRHKKHGLKINNAEEDNSKQKASMSHVSSAATDDNTLKEVANILQDLHNETQDGLQATSDHSAKTALEAQPVLPVNWIRFRNPAMTT
jgi:hypothetical protein